jgi:long-chain fatty acid transport protein
MLGGLATSAMATDGYFSAGYGMKSLGMGGASMAATDNAFAGANNPATAAWAGNRVEAGLNMFMPDRSISRTSNMSSMDGTVTSDNSTFYVPEFGYNRQYSDTVGYGLTFYGNGGMNTSYAPNINCPQGSANMLCGSGPAGVNLEQMILAPTLAIKLTPTQSIGVSPLIVYQKFSATGLQMFGTMSSNANALTNTGDSSSSGLGMRLGYLGKVNEQLTIGASYSPKTTMSKFSGYAGLFANAGEFDIPENYAIGFAYQATPAIQLAMDYQRINYANVAAIGNSSSAQAPLGSATGPGFGWSNIDVIKLGVQWQATPTMVLRAGYNHSQNPVNSANVTFNMLAPGVITNHYTLGGTYSVNTNLELTFAYVYAPSNSVTGASMFNQLQPGMTATETDKMSQQSLGIQVGWKF